MEKVSVYVIMDKLNRNPLFATLDVETIIDFTFDFFEIVGRPEMFDDKVAKIHIKNHRGELPCDFLEENQVLIKSTDTKDFYTPMVQSLDTFRHNLEELKKAPWSHEVTYSIKGKYIYMSRKDTDIKISYKAMDLDDNGFPMIPNNGNFLRALQSYVKKEWYTILCDTGKISEQVLARAEQEYAWNVGSLETDMAKLTLGKAEAFFNSYSQLVPRVNEFRSRFRDYGRKEILKRN